VTRDEDDAARLGAWDDLDPFLGAAIDVAEQFEAYDAVPKSPYAPGPEDLQDAMRRLVAELRRLRRRAGNAELDVNALIDRLKMDGF